MSALWHGGGTIITGGASGLGAATAEKLADAGMKIMIFDIDKEAGTTLAQRLGGYFINVDVSNPASVAAGVTAALDMIGTPRILINCAGIGGAAKTVGRGKAHDPDAFIRTININLIGSFNCASQVAAAMVTGDPISPDGARGVIINTSSVAAYDGQVGQLAYAASKGGIASMTLPMARDLADKGIRVCSIAPGLFLTPLLDGLPPETQDSLGQQVPFPSRLGKASEFADLAYHITQNPMLNGEIIRLDGALRMAPR